MMVCRESQSCSQRIGANDRRHARFKFPSYIRMLFEGGNVVLFPLTTLLSLTSDFEKRQLKPEQSTYPYY